MSSNAQAPAHDADHEVEESARVAAREEDREPGCDDAERAREPEHGEHDDAGRASGARGGGSEKAAEGGPQDQQAGGDAGGVARGGACPGEGA